MADIISDFPDSVLCYILSFLPTKQVVATSSLSKRWKLLWRSVPSLDFEFQNNEIVSHLLSDVLRRSSSLEHIHLQMGWFTAVPSVVFICKTLVVLKLDTSLLENISFVDLPLLKILHLYSLILVHCDLLQQCLSGCLNVEDLEVKCVGYITREKFHSFPKLVRAKIDSCSVPLEIVKNVEFLVTDRIYKEDLVCEFQNLVQLEFATLECSEGWLHVLEVFRHCPKLQTLVICIEGNEEESVLPYPLTVPTCISLHLKTCCLKYYRGSAFEFQFAEYIMLNANYSQIMKFRIRRYEYKNLMRRQNMIRDLSSCSKTSDTCTQSFEKTI
ncbi:hypothetical protein PHAVU_004G015500 [Phaseolus vulgaris]|uniref:F-box domain-containing protein n=1 Tax=Phaseolus vulgaris TaxID=3885 RepID=V7C190_PHAVU|nr:hypothetical protein PHAVU_004G015500g [Phaseolus vulgaris]ESW23065.1 hypothetical protein PHAVU_004G015500g [Phaseolus vulgaris]